MKKFLLYAIIFSVCMGLCACGKTEYRESEGIETEENEIVFIPEEDVHRNPDDGIEGNFEDEEIVDISTDECYIVFLIGSREMTATDLMDKKSSIYTYDLDDLDFGEWKSTKTFDMCHYRWHQLGATSPENWYLIKPTTSDYEITFDANVYSVTYDGKAYYRSDYGDYEGQFVLTPEGVEYK